MAKIPLSVSSSFFTNLPLYSRGKVRDTYKLSNTAALLPVASDRISIFDFVLPALIRQKGEILTAINIFWFRELHTPCSQDILAYGENIEDHLPKRFRGNLALQRRAVIVKKLRMHLVEAIVRGYITGTGWKAYKETTPDHTVCGHAIKAGLVDGDELPTPIFTPTTKAAEGHDEHIDFKEVDPRIAKASLRLFEAAKNIALKRGIILADTKLEFGFDPDSPEEFQGLILGDERFTPDSSRFWLLDDWKRSREKGTSPTSFDKQFVRNWGKKIGLDDPEKFDPLRPEDVERVHSLVVPQDILDATTQIYRYIFYMLTGKRLEKFQRDVMGVPTDPPPVEIVIGSESDIPQVEKGLDRLHDQKIPFRLHVISCHRNPEQLRNYAMHEIPFGATVIAAAGKAAALPGVLQSWLRYSGNGHIPVLGVALHGTDADDLQAAKLSIEKLPGTPVILDMKGGAYTGTSGFVAACLDATEKEFYVPPSTPKEPKFSFITS